MENPSLSGNHGNKEEQLAAMQPHHIKSNKDDVGGNQTENAQTHPQIKFKLFGLNLGDGVRASRVKNTEHKEEYKEENRAENKAN